MVAPICVTPFCNKMLSPIPYLFVCEHTKLSWRDALWGYEHQLIGWSTIVDLAMEKLYSGSNDPLEIELASLTKMETYQVGDLLRKIANATPEESSILVQRKWLYLLLAWLFENKASVSDPLEEVETIYANFDYPSEIESFIRYMPVTDDYDPSAHTKDENEARLFDKWREYLINAQSEFNK
jgi:hypothetical protein